MASSSADLPSEGSEVMEYDLDVKLAWSSIRPPAFPTPHQYQSCYCEENVYLLIQELSTQLALSNADEGMDYVSRWDVRAVFISNETKTTLMFQQKASKAPEAGWPVVWDYHVVAAVSCTLLATAEGKRCGTRTWIYDADSVLSSNNEAQRCPVPIDTYINATFSNPAVTPPHFVPVFRLVPAHDFLEVFASDRSHMKSVSDQDPSAFTWHSPPPAWPVIRGKDAQSAHNLMSAFVDIRLPEHGGSSDPRFGTVYDFTAFCSLAWTNDSTVPGSTLACASQSKVGSQPSLPRQQESQAGGRVTCSLFPAYLHAVQQHRAHQPDSIVVPNPSP